MFPLAIPDEELLNALIEDNRLEYDTEQLFDVFCYIHMKKRNVFRI